MDVFEYVTRNTYEFTHFVLIDEESTLSHEFQQQQPFISLFLKMNKRIDSSPNIVTTSIGSELHLTTSSSCFNVRPSVSYSYLTHLEKRTTTSREKAIFTIF